MPYPSTKATLSEPLLFSVGVVLPCWIVGLVGGGLPKLRKYAAYGTIFRAD